MIISLSLSRFLLLREVSGKSIRMYVWNSDSNLHVMFFHTWKKLVKRSSFWLRLTIGNHNWHHGNFGCYHHGKKGLRSPRIHWKYSITMKMTKNYFSKWNHFWVRKWQVFYSSDFFLFLSFFFFLSFFLSFDWMLANTQNHSTLSSPCSVTSLRGYWPFNHLESYCSLLRFFCSSVEVNGRGSHKMVGNRKGWVRGMIVGGGGSCRTNI